MTGVHIHFRHLTSQKIQGLQVLDVVCKAESGRDASTAVFFAKGVAPGEARAAFGQPPRAETMINGAPILIFEGSDEVVPGLDACPGEPEILAGCNVAIATRNGEPAKTIVEWLTYHANRCAMQGAVIFERARRDEDSKVWEDVKDLLEQANVAMRVVVVYSDVPLGAPGWPAEGHPFSVPEAPGRDRMEVPQPDPWRALLGEMSIYEIARWRFLGNARAVTNIDLHDLLMPSSKGVSPFDAASEVPGRAIELAGQHCYPWRVRKGHRPRYADHICVQFDRPLFRQRWCVALEGLAPDAYFRCKRVANTKVAAQLRFYRFMSIRHPVTQTSRIVAKTSLIESDRLLTLASDAFDFKPVRAPEVELEAPERGAGNRTAIVTTMKNEGPFILEWLAYHRAIGVEDFMVYTNDCTDGTDTMFDLLQSKGLVQHRENPFRETKLKPQHAALRAAESEPMIENADWLICMDVDEFLNVKVGDGHLSDLYQAVGQANLISCTWRLFGNADTDSFHEEPTIAQFTRCAEEFSPKPHQAWGFKTLFRNVGIFKKLGVHRPKGLRPQLWEQIQWVNGSGNPLPKSEFRNAWRSTSRTYGYDLVSLNHYAVRNAESFLVKRDRGRVNHVDRDQGLSYWFRMNNNATTDHSIQRHLPKMKAELARLMADPEIAEQHRTCVAAHRAKIAELKENPGQRAFFDTLTSARMKALSRMHRHFGSSVFWVGPESVPDDVVWADHDKDFLFTVEIPKTGS